MRIALPALILSAALAFLMMDANAEEPPVIVGWTDVPPLFRVGDEGEPRGFSAELIHRLAEIAGFEIVFRRFRSMKNAAAGQINGESVMIPGIAPLPDLAPSNVFSRPVATTRVRLLIRAEDVHDDSVTKPEGRRIGTVPPAVGSEPSPLLQRNINVRLPSAGTALIKLLSGEIDGVLFPEEVMRGEAHSAGLDHRIAAVGPTVQAFDRVVAIHESRADLLEPVNAAIAALEASGELADLRRRWFLEPPPPVPDVLTVGVAHFPPYQVVEADGSFTGLAVEALRDLAERASLSLRFVKITEDLFALGPGAGGYDMLPQAAISERRRDRFDFTHPLESERVSLFVRTGASENRQTLRDFAGRSIGVSDANVGRRIAEAEDRVKTRVFEDHGALLDGLLRGQVDAALVTDRSFRRVIEKRKVAERVRKLAKPVHHVGRGVALRFGLGLVRERLNAVIPAYLSSDGYSELRRRWLGGQTRYWTDQRVDTLMWVSGALILLLTALLAFSMLWRRHQVDRERRRFATEVVRHLPVGVILVSPAGTIDFINLEGDDQTPRNNPLFLEGQNFRSGVRRMIEEGWVDMEGLSEAEMFKILAEEGVEDGYVREIRFVDGRIYRRSVRRLESGSSLIVREDVTEYRNQLDQIDTLNRTLQDKIMQADAANQELRAFAYATSHDLKSPTNTMMMTVDALAENLEGRLSEDDSHLLDVARRTLAGMRALIDDILSYTDTIGSAPEREPVDLNKVAAEVLEALSADIEVNAAEIRLAPLPSLDASPVQMRQLVQNLVSNAVKFHPPEKPPAVDVQPADAPPGYVGFKVRDNGIGIAPEQQDKVFQLFARLNRRSTYAGTGLGLAICQRIAFNHGGRIDLESTPGEGTCFTVLLEKKTDDPEPHAHRRQ